MTGHARIGVQLWPGGTPDYRSWRDAVLRSEDMGVDVIFGYDHFHKPFVQLTSEGPSAAGPVRCQAGGRLARAGHRR